MIVSKRNSKGLENRKLLAKYLIDRQTTKSNLTAEHMWARV